jgi:hypothetical protein
MKYGYSLPERLNFFKELLANTQQNSIGKWDVPIGGYFQQIDIFRVPVELPKYRLDNTRTLALQEQYIFTNNKDEDFFSDVESDKIQEIQHDLLKKLITSPDKDKDMISYFSKTDQTEPLILTNDGFVISGNRRLCTYRELLDPERGDYAKNKRFSLVRVVILPKLDAEKIDQIEDYLEQQTDIKQHFTWFNRALGYQRRIHKFNYSDEQLASITGEKKNEIRRLIDTLEIADRYLDSIYQTKNYDIVKDDEFAFEKIYECKSKDKGSVTKKSAFEKLSFLAIKNKDNFSGRMYKNIPLIFDAQVEIHNELEENFEDELNQIKSEQEKDNTLTSIGLFPDPAISIIKLLDNSEIEEKIIDVVTEKIVEVAERERENKRRSSVSDCLSKAQKWVVQANFFANHESEKTGLLNQIKMIEKEIEKLKAWINTK